VRDRKGLLEIFKVLPHAEDLVCQPILGRDDSNIGRVLSPHDVSLLKDVKLRKKKIAGLLLLCIAVLLAATNTSSHARLSLGGCSVLAIIVGE
jgi:hypothetical protein